LGKYGGGYVWGYIAHYFGMEPVWMLGILATPGDKKISVSANTSRNTSQIILENLKLRPYLQVKITAYSASHNGSRHGSTPRKLRQVTTKHIKHTNCLYLGRESVTRT
jgi:hypothetical protein